MRLSKWTFAVVLTSFLCLGGSAGAQTPALSNADVIKLTQSGLSEGVIIATIANATSSQFDVSTAGLVELKAAGVAEAVILQMMARVTAAVAPPTPASPPASVRPIADAASRQAVAVQQGGAPAMKRSNPGLMWAGVAVWGAGLTMEILAQTTLKIEECFVIGSFVACETGANKTLLYSGLGVAGAGITMWIVGNRKVPALPSVTFRRGGVSISHSLGF